MLAAATQASERRSFTAACGERLPGTPSAVPPAKTTWNTLDRDAKLVAEAGSPPEGTVVAHSAESPKPTKIYSHVPKCAFYLAAAVLLTETPMNPKANRGRMT